MSDIDFDELDRAVNGATGGNNTPTPEPSVNDAPAVPSVPTFNLVERTTVSPISSGAVTTPSSTAASTAPAARRSSGRFMDMVHSSSDMRLHVPSSRVENRPEPAVEIKPEVVVPEVIAPEVIAPEVVESPVWNEPLESPFIQDAKVEKRPLGGGEVIPSETAPIVGSFDFQGLLDEPEEELLEAPEPQERIEATTMPDPIDFVAASATVDEIEQPQPVIALQQPTEEPIGPTSITPQYKEQVSTNQESGAMYDTESYHQPVSVPVKKKSGWATVLWIVLLVILGAGGGWAIFTYVVPML